MSAFLAPPPAAGRLLRWPLRLSRTLPITLRLPTSSVGGVWLGGGGGKAVRWTGLALLLCGLEGCGLFSEGFFERHSLKAAFEQSV